MSSTRSRSDFVWYRDSVTELMEAGTGFGEVENAIDLAHVTQDQKAALWLFAFCMRDRGDQLSDARAHLAAVTD